MAAVQLPLRASHFKPGGKMYERVQWCLQRSDLRPRLCVAWQNEQRSAAVPLLRDVLSERRLQLHSAVVERPVPDLGRARLAAVSDRAALQSLVRVRS